MSQDSIQTLINLLMLFALFAGLALWWLTKHGGRRGRIADRARNAVLSQRAEIVTLDVEEEDNWRTNLAHRLARIGDRAAYKRAMMKAEPNMAPLLT